MIKYTAKVVFLPGQRANSELYLINFLSKLIAKILRFQSWSRGDSRHLVNTLKRT